MMWACGHTDDFPLRHKESKLVLALLGQLAELNAVDLAANAGRELLNLCDALGQEIRERRVGILAVVVVLEGFEGREPDITYNFQPTLSPHHIVLLKETYLVVSLSQTGR